MHVLIVQFGLAGMDDSELRSTADAIAHDFAGIPGCIEKTWIADAETGTYGGVYKFQDRSALETYLASDLWAGVAGNPAFRNLITQQFDVMEGPSRITRGMDSSRSSVPVDATAR